MITGQEYDPEKTDLWSAGITLFFILTGKLPFNDKQIKELYRKIIDGTIDYPKHLSSEAIEILKGILKGNPKNRMSFKDVFAHSWMQKNKPEGYPLKRVEDRVDCVKF